jgi:perosamine synthetase
MSRIHYTKPSITALEVGYAADAAEHGWGPKCYEYISRFEALFCEHLGVAHAVATSSCTGAIHLGMAALGIGPGDEVILGDINWIASAAPVMYLGARPVLVDVLADSWCVDPDAVEAAITPRTKAILAVHLYGNLCDLDRLCEIGRRHGIPVIEDAAEAIGSVWHGRRAGAIGAFGTFSFHGTKTLTTGEGGMFVTQDAALYQRVLTLNNHGRASSQPRQFWPDELGFKYKMSNIEAAIGCGQIERVDALIARKREIFHAYRQAFADLDHLVSMNPEPQGTQNGYWMPTLMVSEDLDFDRQRLLDGFSAAQIDGRVFFWPLSSLPMFEGQDISNPVAASLSPRGVNLPTYHDMSDSDIARVVAVVRDVLLDCARRSAHVAA